MQPTATRPVGLGKHHGDGKARVQDRHKGIGGESGRSGKADAKGLQRETGSTRGVAQPANRCFLRCLALIRARFNGDR